jgi:hypothetical protein
MSTKSRSLTVKKRTVLDYPRLSMFFCETHAKISVSLSMRIFPPPYSNPTHSSRFEGPSKTIMAAGIVLPTTSIIF